MRERQKDVPFYFALQCGVDGPGGIISDMIVVRIHSWDDPDRWTKVTSWYVRDFAKRLADHTDFTKPDCEALAKRVLKDRECSEIPLAKAKDRYGATTIRSFLDSFGANTTVEEI